jgi:LuxR family maltose regulon positive regulatory protein
LQWRRWWLDSGAHVAWFDAGEADHPARFALALGHAFRVGGVLDEIPDVGTAGASDAYAGLTAILAAIAERGMPVGLVIDEAERLPESSVRGALQYLLLNAPANLHVAIGTRVALPLLLSELAAKGQCGAVATEDLRLRLEESIAILVERLGDRISLDDRAHLHDATEGWPIGLQLAISAIEREPDAARAVRSLSARHGTLQEYFVTSLFSRLPPDVADWLVRASILEHFDPDLFQAVTGCRQPRAVLDRLVRETPLMSTGERTHWMRLHPLARDFLLSRLEALSPREQAGLHARASRWYAERDRFHEAATHALAAGEETLAQTYAARSLWALSTSGMLAEAREWLDRLPAQMLAGDTELRLVAASVLALGERNAEAIAIARDVLAEPDTTPQATATALRIGAGASIFADRLGLLPGLLERWPGAGDPGGGPLYAVAALNTRAMFALHRGETGQVRALIAQQVPHGDAGTLRLAAAFGRMIAALSHLWDGHPARAEAALLPALLHAERDGRRGMIASLHASIVARARYERGDIAQAQALLANRLDVIERCGFPDNLLTAYRTLASAALAEGDESGALAFLQNLEALGVRRDLPRLRAIALADQVRVHAAHARKETVVRLLDALDGLAPAFDVEGMRPLQAEYRLAAAIARAHAALADDRLDAAELHLADADAIAESISCGNDIQRVKVLRGVAAWKRGEEGAALSLLREAQDLAAIAGHVRLAADAHPLAARLLAEAREVPRPAATSPLRSTQSRAALLTSKEAQVLDLLGQGLPNKAIARALDVSGETVKWHLKNLFAKLSAGSRRHAVERARMLGLLG